MPDVIQPLLVEFQDVLTDDLSEGLPPLRDIRHAIDLILGSILLNRSTYRLRPTEVEELQKQV